MPSWARPLLSSSVTSSISGNSSPAPPPGNGWRTPPAGSQARQVGVIVDGQGEARLDAVGQLAGDGLQSLALGQQHPAS